MSDISAKKTIRDLAAQAQKIVETKSLTAGEKNRRLDQLQIKMKAAQDEISLNERIRSQNLSVYGHGDSTGETPDSGQRFIAPIAFTEPQSKAFHEAVTSHRSFKSEVGTKDLVVESPSQAMPATLLPGILRVNQFEPVRIAEQIPAGTTSAPSIEYIRHSATTGNAAITAPGALKPEVTLTTDRIITSVSKIAVFTRILDEDYHDYSAWMGYVQDELTRLVIDVENNQILNGDGTDGNLTGLLHTEGILSRPMGTDTPLDAVEQAIADLRSGPSKVTPDFMVMAPATFSAIRRSKDGYGRYLLSADPSADQVSQLWGIPVVQTTTAPAGVALVASRQAAQLSVRQGLTVETNFSGDDFQENKTSVRTEERLALLVPRPTAMISVTGLPGAAA